VTARLRRRGRREEGVFRRAVRDTVSVANHRWRFQLPALLVTAGFAAVGALLPSDAAAGIRVGSAVLGTLDGVVVVGIATFAAMLVVAPYRQRDEARARLRSHEGSGSELKALAEEFDAFVVAERAIAPESGISIFTRTLGMSREDHNRALHESNQRVIDARQHVLGRYHTEFRARILDVLRTPGHERLLELHGDLARDPGYLGELETLNSVLQHAVRVAAGPARETLPNHKRLAHAIRRLSTEIAAGLDARDAERPGGGPEAEAAPQDPAMTARDAERLRKAQARFERETEARYYTTQRDRALAFFDEAVPLGVADGSYRRRVQTPDGDLRGLVEFLHGLASDLDGRA